MALELVVPNQLQNLGTSGTQVKPITEGERRTVVKDQRFGGIFSALDELGTGAVNSVKDVLNAVTAKEIKNLVGGAETSDTTEGDPFSTPGNAVSNKKPDQPFYVKYQRELLLSAGAVALFAIVIAVKK